MAASRSLLLLVLLELYTAFAAGPFLWVAIDVAAHDHRDLAQPLRLSDRRAHWEKFPDAWFNSNYSVYFSNSLIVVLCAVAAPDRDRRDGRALPRALPLPRQPPALLPHLLGDHLPAADHHHRAVPDPGAVRPVQHRIRA